MSAETSQRTNTSGPTREVDHVIIGAGMAGLVLRHLLRERDVVLLDPAPFAYKIGESVVPEQFGHPDMRALVPLAQKLPSYQPKMGTVFVSDRSVASFPLPPGEAGVSMHVARHELERLMAEHWELPIVREKVVHVDVARHCVTTDRAVYVSRGPVLDCSGPAMVVATALGEVEKLFATAATWAYWDVVSADERAFYDHVQRSGSRYLRYDAMRRRVLPEPDELPGWAPVRTTYLTRLSGNIWTWQIPLRGGALLSYGVISREAALDPETYRQIALENAAPGYELRARPPGDSPFDRVHQRAGFARRARRAASRDYVLLGDAFAFADPVYSVGTALAVNKAIEVADALLTTGWTEDVSAAYVQRCETLLERALRAFDLWYRGEVVTSDDAAEEVRDNFLNGTAFQMQVAENYGNVSTDVLWAGDPSPRAAAARELRAAAGVPVQRQVGTLIGGGSLADWTLVDAMTTRTGLLLRWRHDGKPDLEMNVQFDARGTRAFRQVGDTALSYESLLMGPYPFDGTVDRLFREIAAQIAPRQSDWKAVWRLAVPSVPARLVPRT